MKLISVALVSASLVLGATLQSSAQETEFTLQTLTVNLTFFDQPTPTSLNKIRVTSKDMIRLFNGANVPGGQLVLVTPVASGVYTNTGNLNAFLRITQRGSNILEVPSPDAFNLYQDAVVADLRRDRVGTSVGTDRFSIASGPLQTELQGTIVWKPVLINTRSRFLPIFSVSPIGSFSTTVSGTGSIADVTQPLVPISGTISAGAPTIEVVTPPAD